VATSSAKLERAVVTAQAQEPAQAQAPAGARVQAKKLARMAAMEVPAEVAAKAAWLAVAMSPAVAPAVSRQAMASEATVVLALMVPWFEKVCWSGVTAQERLVRETCRRGGTAANHHLPLHLAIVPLHSVTSPPSACV
jgi:hypothetical protein